MYVRRHKLPSYPLFPPNQSYPPRLRGNQKRGKYKKYGASPWRWRVENGDMLHYLTNYLCGGQQRTKAGKTRLFLPPSDTSAAFLSYKYGEIVR